jgi:hypothetical protein
VFGEELGPLLVLAGEPAQAAVDRLHHGDQQAVPGHRQDPVVETGVDVGDRLRVVRAGRRRRAVEELLQLGEIGPGGALRGQPGGVHLQCLAQFEELGDVRRGQTAYDRAARGLEEDEALGDQGPDRLADRYPGDPEPLGQLAFDQPVAGQQPPGDDLLPQRAEHPLTHRPQRFHRCHGSILAEPGTVLPSRNRTDTAGSR